MPLFLICCFPVDFQEAKRPLKTKSGKRPVKVGKRPIKEGKRPIKAMVLVGISTGCLMGCFRAAQPWQKGCFRAPQPWRKTAPKIGDFCCIKFGGFCRGFSWRIFLGTFSHKNEEKNPATKSATKSGGSKNKIREKSVLPKTDPNERPMKRSM